MNNPTTLAEWTELCLRTRETPRTTFRLDTSERLGLHLCGLCGSAQSVGVLDRGYGWLCADCQMNRSQCAECFEVIREDEEAVDIYGVASVHLACQRGCARCGEMGLSMGTGGMHDLAEVADGLVHASCMKDGEELA